MKIIFTIIIFLEIIALFIVAFTVNNKKEDYQRGARKKCKKEGGKWNKRTKKCIQKIDVSDVKKIDVSEAKKIDTGDTKKIDVSDTKKIDTSDVKKIGTSDVKKIGASDVKKIGTSDVKKIDTGDTKNNNIIYNSEGQIVYEGNIKDGIPNGKGILYNNGEIVYEGDMQDGIPTQLDNISASDLKNICNILNIECKSNDKNKIINDIMMLIK